MSVSSTKRADRLVQAVQLVLRNHSALMRRHETENQEVCGTVVWNEASQRTEIRHCKTENATNYRSPPLCALNPRRCRAQELKVDDTVIAEWHTHPPGDRFSPPSDMDCLQNVLSTINKHPIASLVLTHTHLFVVRCPEEIAHIFNRELKLYYEQHADLETMQSSVVSCRVPLREKVDEKLCPHLFSLMHNAYKTYLCLLGNKKLDDPGKYREYIDFMQTSYGFNIQMHDASS